MLSHSLRILCNLTLNVIFPANVLGYQRTLAITFATFIGSVSNHVMCGWFKNSLIGYSVFGNQANVVEYSSLYHQGWVIMESSTSFEFVRVDEMGKHARNIERLPE